MVVNPESFGDSPDMIDPLADIVTLLQPEARFFKLLAGVEAWCVRREGWEIRSRRLSSRVPAD